MGARSRVTPARVRLPVLAPRPRGAHKGDLGRVLVVAGSAAMPGAAFLCGEAAMRAGAGLCTIAVPRPLLPVLGVKVTVETLAPLASTRRGTLSERALRALLTLARGFAAVALGPGLSVDPATARLVRRAALALPCPLVLDADGLNAFAGRAAALASRSSPTVLTPHPGEAARLLGCTRDEIQRDRRAAALRLARLARAVVDLKGAGSVVTDGLRVYVNTTGSPALATGGTGDVLAGVVAAFLARGLTAFDATVLAAWVHGRAGDFAARRIGADGCLATDVLPELPRAIRERIGHG